MDRSSATDASPGNSGSVATLNGLSAARGFPSGPDPHSLFAIPTGLSANDWLHRPTASSSPAPRHMHVSSSGLEGMFESLGTNNNHFGSRPHGSPSALLSAEVARVPLAADLMPGAPSRRARKRKTSDPPSEASSLLRPLVGQTPSAASIATYTHPQSARRVSARISRSPFDAGDSVFENSSRKRKTSPDRKTPPPKKRAPARLKADPDEDVKTEHDSTCCICMTEPEPADLASINGCEHMFCFGCIEKWADRENTCPLCKQRFTKIDRVNKTKKRAVKSSKKVKNRSQRLEMTQSIGLEGLFGELGRSGIAIESIFSRLGGSQFNAHFARIVVNGVGGGGVFEAQLGPPPRPFYPPQSSAPPSVPEAAGMPPRLEDVFFGSDDDDEDDAHNGFEDDGYNGFVASIRNMESTRGGPTFFGMGARRGRSYASNMNDVDAGETADNALEIDDSDDDEVEVVRVSRGNL